MLINQHASKHITIAFDSSYVSKSGKATPGTGYFWSGVAGKVKWGLEIAGIGAVDIDNHTAFHLEAVQTPSNVENLFQHYAQTLNIALYLSYAITTFMLSVDFVMMLI